MLFKNASSLIIKMLNKAWTNCSSELKMLLNIKKILRRAKKTFSQSR